MSKKYKRIKNTYLRCMWILIASMTLAALAAFLSSVGDEKIQDISIPTFLIAAITAAFTLIFIPCYAFVQKYGAYQPYHCVCTIGGKITLGFRLVLPLNIIFIPVALILLPLLTREALLEQDYSILLAPVAIISILTYVTYRDYQVMRKAHHSKRCSLRAAVFALFYTARTEGLTIAKVRRHHVRAPKPL